jgi:peptide deformylase
MAVLNIVKAGAPVLKGTAKPVRKITKQTRQLLDDMAETMYAAEGCGLAGPQVNVPEQIIVLDDGNGLIELINPQIVESEGNEVGCEGCLSIPGYYGDVERFTKITVHALNRHGKEVIYTPEGFLARIFQHEIDHLKGILFIEKADNLRQVTE